MELIAEHAPRGAQCGGQVASPGTKNRRHIMETAMAVIEDRRLKFENCNFFDGVLKCSWARMAIEQGSDQIQAMSYAIFYQWK